MDLHKTLYPNHAKWGIHLLVSQHEDGVLTIGDSHELSDWHDPFLRADVEEWILEYYDTFLDRSKISIIERWHGVYAKHPTEPFVLQELEPGVVALTGVGGAGMTLSFGLGQRLIANRLSPLQKMSLH